MHKRRRLVGFGFSLALSLGSAGLALAQVPEQAWPPPYWSEQQPAATDPSRLMPQPQMQMQPQMQQYPSNSTVWLRVEGPQPQAQVPMYAPRPYFQVPQAPPGPNIQPPPPPQYIYYPQPRPAPVLPAAPPPPPPPPPPAPKVEKPPVVKAPRKPLIETHTEWWPHKSVLDRYKEWCQKMAAQRACKPVLTEPELPNLPGLDYIPEMIGDLAPGAGLASFSGNLPINVRDPVFGFQRQEIARNNTPLPRTRAYFLYDFAAGATKQSFGALHANQDFSRYVIGGEYSFFYDLVSVEVRLPFTRSLGANLGFRDHDGNFDLSLNQDDIRLGNVNFITKFLLWQNAGFALSTGVGVNTPTAPGLRTSMVIEDPNFPVDGGTQPVLASLNAKFRNRVVNVSPFIAAAWTPGPRFFTQTFVQLDVPASKMRLDVDGEFSFSGTPVDLTQIPNVTGRLAQQTLLRVNTGVGYWVWKKPWERVITGFAPTVEMNYTTTLQDAENFHADLLPEIGLFQPVQLFAGTPSNRSDVLNLTLGSTLEFANRSTVAGGFVLPLHYDHNRPYDYAFLLQFNYRFGCQPMTCCCTWGPPASSCAPVCHPPALPATLPSPEANPVGDPVPADDLSPADGAGQ